MVCCLSSPLVTSNLSGYSSHDLEVVFGRLKRKIEDDIRDPYQWRCMEASNQLTDTATSATNHTPAPTA